MSKSRAYALCAAMFGLIAIDAVTRHDIVAGVLVFLVAIACASRANYEWKREHP